MPAGRDRANSTPFTPARRAASLSSTRDPSAGLPDTRTSAFASGAGQVAFDGLRTSLPTGLQIGRAAFAGTGLTGTFTTSRGVGGAQVAAASRAGIETSRPATTTAASVPAMLVRRQIVRVYTVPPGWASVERQELD